MKCPAQVCSKHLILPIRRESAVLFSDFDRTDDSAKCYRETVFEFIDRSASPDVVAARELIEQEFSNYLETEKHEMQSRLQSRDARKFHSACFELLLYGLLIRRGYCLEAHPDPGNGTGNRPDFLVTSPSGESFFLEAVLAAEVSDGNEAAEAMKEDVLDALDRAPHANFYLDIIETGAPASQPPARRLQNHVHQWLNGLNADEVRAAAAGNYESLPRERWTHDGWQLKFRALPKDRNRGELDRLIGALSGDGGFIDLRTPIRRAIRRKGQRYGDLPLPLVVAVNVEAFHMQESDEVDALFGSEAIAVCGGKSRVVREHDGAWHNGRAPRSARVSAAWLFNDLTFWSIAARRQTLYINPWAVTPLGSVLHWLPMARVDGNKLVRSEGVSPGEIYGMS